MKLLKLKISNLFGLKENNEFNFEESNLIAIVGKNGSGKSSIMDATRLAFSEIQLLHEKLLQKIISAKDVIPAVLK